MNYGDAIEKLSVYFSSPTYEPEILQAKSGFFGDVGVDDKESERYEQWLTILQAQLQGETLTKRMLDNALASNGFSEQSFKTFMADALKTVPNGVYRFRDYMDDDGVDETNVLFELAIEAQDGKSTAAFWIKY